jgi:hypothetical protein
MSVPDADVQVAVDPVEMDQVQLLERSPVAMLRQIHELADVASTRARLFSVASELTRSLFPD